MRQLIPISNHETTTLFNPRKAMKKLFMLSLLLSLLISGNILAQSSPTTQKMSVTDRLTKARAAKAQKKIAKTTGADSGAAPAVVTQSDNHSPGRATQKSVSKIEKASPADYQTPIDKTKQGPNGEVVHTGARGGYYYINKNGNKTYLSSNL